MEHARLLKITRCRSCSSGALSVFLDLGSQPIANELVDEGRLHIEDRRFPLELALCESCSLVQVTETIPPHVLFGEDYPYYSSFSAAFVEHSRRHVLEILKARELGPKSLVIEVASNDGYLLKNFIEAGVPVLGIDPAPGPAKAARAAGVPTIQDFFGTRLAEKLAAEGKQADVMIANNVAAHVDSINDFIGGFAILLKEDGIARFEFAYLRDLVEKCEFDTIYHEHLFYYSLTALEPLFLRHRLHLNDAERLWIHGGSLRVTVSKRPGRSERLVRGLDEEKSLGIAGPSFYRSFSEKVGVVRSNLLDLVRKERKNGARFAAYGAAAKGATLLNYVRFDEGAIEYVVDKNPHKVGKYMPGVRIPIRPVETLLEDRPDYVLLLAWNFGAEIMKDNAEYTRAGGKFVVPIPEIRIV